MCRYGCRPLNAGLLLCTHACASPYGQLVTFSFLSRSMTEQFAVMVVLQDTLRYISFS